MWNWLNDHSAVNHPSTSPNEHLFAALTDPSGPGWIVNATN